MSLLILRFCAAGRAVSCRLLTPRAPPQPAPSTARAHRRTKVGTTAEWLFLASGHTMLTVKGLVGGEKALPSSFAMSAAAFGRTKR